MSTSNALSTTFHRDGSVTLWNVFLEQWERTTRPSDRVLASLESDERRKVERHIAKYGN